ncbi:unnamed protein product [Thelazia callipaeda]|uniref:ZM domain-containing protein n=1 Tax=Thelazia callipaeda TaxID=103827 RepID=A0A0N5D3T7_THECL|nr:unnamed protein product [Thelazia callipaeda]
MVYFGCVKKIRITEKKRRASCSTSTRMSSTERAPTFTSTSLKNGKLLFPMEKHRSAYSPEHETPILQSSMHTQEAYVPPPPTYAIQQTDYRKHQRETSRGNYLHTDLIRNTQSRKGSMVQHEVAGRGSRESEDHSMMPSFVYHTSSV